MDMMTQVAEAMQTVLMDQADTLGCAVGFVKRQRKLSGSRFVQAVVFGFQAKPDASYTDLRQSAASVGAVVSPQGLPLLIVNLMRMGRKIFRPYRGNPISSQWRW